MSVQCASESYCTWEVRTYWTSGFIINTYYQDPFQVLIIHSLKLANRDEQHGWVHVNEHTVLNFSKIYNQVFFSFMHAWLYVGDSHSQANCLLTSTETFWLVSSSSRPTSFICGESSGTRRVCCKFFGKDIFLPRWLRQHPTTRRYWSNLCCQDPVIKFISINMQQILNTCWSHNSKNIMIYAAKEQYSFVVKQSTDFFCQHGSSIHVAYKSHRATLYLLKF